MRMAWSTSSASRFHPSGQQKILHDLHYVPQWVVRSPLVMMILGFLFRLLVLHPHAVAAWPASPPGMTFSTGFLLNKWYFDELYDLIFVRPAQWIGRLLWKGGDGRVIDGVGPRRHRGAGHRRHQSRGQDPDRLRLPLRLRHAHRRRGSHHLFRIRGIIDHDRLAHPFHRHVPAAGRRRADPVDPRR